MTWVNFIIQILHRLSSTTYICLVFGVPQHNDNKRQPISFLDSIYHLSHPITNYSLIINLEWNEIVFTAIYELMILVESRMSFSRTNCSQLSNGNFSMKHWGGMYGFYVLVSVRSEKEFVVHFCIRLLWFNDLLSITEWIWNKPMIY